MKNQTATVMSYVKQVLAIVKGDANEANAAKNQRLATSQIQIQISLLEAQEVQNESKLEIAEEKFKNAFYGVDSNGNIRTIGEDYTQTLLDLDAEITAIKAENEELSKVIAKLKDWSKKIKE